ncbi:adenylate/guanylate cyclase domain-containing protein [Ferrimonas marina]|uniref:Adenylate cyclase n=1 Tax=Ferrimonas marina TaxID=299255 RepID=A0A1M5ZG93_9GAMM|nr:adenylate/guanylate cyclase domain-containing protein [Ferrimonas marina]SHI23202.1 adenylate cyclase [Ferrimonas marina]
MAAFVSFRYTQSPESLGWIVTKADMVTLSIYLGTILGCLHWLSNLISTTSPIRRMSYVVIVIFKGLFLLIGALVLIKITLWINTWTPAPHLDLEYNQLTQSLLNSAATQTLVIYLVWVRLCLAFLEQMVLLVGQRNLINMGLGKYHRPRQEERVFLFIDMVGSTAHAEALGDYRFSRLVQDCFDLLSSCVQRHRGEIYRYIGDAVMISWKIREGQDMERALSLYYSFVQMLEWNQHYFQEQYGFVPRFKGAAHGGKVMTAVVGVDKQEISYFSDVLNTLARLQDQCGPLKRDLLVSGQYLALLGEEPVHEFESIGPMRLKGKQQEVEVFAVNPPPSVI